MSINLKVNIFEATRQIFGVEGYLPKISGQINPDIKYNEGDVKTLEVADSIGTSIFGTPIWETLKLKIPGTEEFLTFEDAPLMTVNLKKNIVKTKVQKRKGTVKEYINESDHIINIRGLMVNHEGEDLPYDLINIVDDVLREPVALEVESRLLNLLGIYNIVVESHSYPASEKFSNIQAYSISCVSDDPIELIIDAVPDLNFTFLYPL